MEIRFSITKLCIDKFEVLILIKSGYYIVHSPSTDLKKVHVSSTTTTEAKTGRCSQKVRFTTWKQSIFEIHYVLNVMNCNEEQVFCNIKYCASEGPWLDQIPKNRPHSTVAPTTTSYCAYKSDCLLVMQWAVSISTMIQIRVRQIVVISKNWIFMNWNYTFRPNFG